jgi:hypothetical protein
VVDFLHQFQDELQVFLIQALIRGDLLGLLVVPQHPFLG